MTRDRAHVLLLNIGHFVDHLVMLVFATAAALVLAREWGLSYSELIPYATPGFVAFGVFALPAGWLADRWGRERMMLVYFLGVGLATLACATVSGPQQMAVALFAVGVFAAIYHPVGLALVVAGARDGGSGTGAGMALAKNGVWGNLGVGGAALITGALIDAASWRAAFLVLGVATLALAAAYAVVARDELARGAPSAAARVAHAAAPASLADAASLKRIAVIVVFTMAISALSFQSATFALPKILDERLSNITTTATGIGWLAFLVFAVASIAQLLVGHLLDRTSPRNVFVGVAALQALFYAAMPGLTGWPAFAAACGFMLGAFGQLPINDYIIGALAKKERMASIYGARFLVTFSALAAALPLIAWVHGNWGFDALFRILAVASALVLIAAALLPARLPAPAARK